MMKTNRENIKVIPLSYSIVQIWQQPLPQLPSISPDFFNNIFGSPATTNHSINRMGIVATQMLPPVLKGNLFTNPINPLIHIGFDAFSVTHTDLNEFLKVYEKCHNQLNPSNINVEQFKPKQIGINIEYEVVFNETSIEVLKNRFATPEPNAEFKNAVLSEIKLTLQEAEANKMMNIVIQPRLGNNNALFFQVNDHFGTVDFKTFLSKDELTSITESSIQKFSKKALPYIF